MRLLTFIHDDIEKPGTMLRDGAILDIGLAGTAATQHGKTVREIPRSMMGIIEVGASAAIRALVDMIESADSMRRAVQDAGAVLDAKAVKLAAPVPRPSFLWCQGLAYRSHLEEMGVPVPGAPSAFAKAPSSICGSGDTILLPPSCPDMVDYEGEFAVIIGRKCHQVTPPEARDCIFGYTALNDVSARDWVAPALRPNQSRLDAVMSWETNINGKQFATFTPMGPVMTTADELTDPGDVTITTTLNGQVMQCANTSDLIFPVQDVIAYYAQWFVFMPGDIISTGTPAGVGFGRKPPVFLRAGDIIDVSISGIGTLTNRVGKN